MPTNTPCTPEDSSSLFVRIGGAPAVAAAVTGFYDKVLADPLLIPFFANVAASSENKGMQKGKMERFLAAAMGGPGPWRGKDMATAHKNLGIEHEHFDKVAEHLTLTLKELSVATELIDEVMALVGSLRSAVVQQKID